MKKILYVTTVSLTLNTFLIPHIKYLKENGYDVQIASNIDVELSEKFKELGIKHTKIDFSRNPFSIKNIKAYKQINDLYNKERFDIVHVHTPVAAFITRLALKNESIKIIYTCHGFHFYKGASLINWIIYYPIEKLAAKWTDTLITINKEDFNRAEKFKLRKNGQIKLMHGVGINPDEYILSEFNRDEYRKSIGVEKNDFMLLILADINKNKNHIRVIKAIKELIKNDDHIKVICAGEGPLRSELSKKVVELGLEDKMKFLGFRRDVKELINSSDCVGLFSMREGLPKSLMEAMCCGKPLIASNIRGCRDIAGNKNVGILVNPNDYKSILNGLKKIINTKYNFKIIKKEVEKYNLSRVLKEVYEIHEI